MAYKHIGTATTLATITSAGGAIANADIAYIWLNDYEREMVFDSTSVVATDTTNHPYAVRPCDFNESTNPGVWIENCGANQPPAWSGDQIRQGSIISNNWIDGTSGMKIDLDNEQILIKDSTFGDDGIQIGWFSSAYKLNMQNGNVYLEFDGSHLTISVDANVGTGVGIIYKGGQRWLYDFNPANNGTVTPYGFNLFLGVEAGNLTIGETATNVIHSSHNIGVGYQSLHGLTTGYQNIAVGYKVLCAATSGGMNIGVGYESLLALTTGSSNIGVGNGCLNTNEIGSNNIAIGGLSLYYQNEGDSNIGIGTAAGRAITSGYYNIAIGSEALYTTTLTGWSNIFIGHRAGYEAKQAITDNIAIGKYALKTIEEGDYNIAIGSSAASLIDYAEKGVYLGALIQPTDGSSGSPTTNEIVIGYNAIGNGSNTITIGNTSIIANYFEGAIYFTELSTDPADPAEGQAVMWMSDGTGAGDDGDMMVKITAGGSTKTITLVDFSAF